MNKKKEILTYPHSILLAKCHPVEEINQETKNSLDKMIKIMVALGGIGLAAPQIGITQRLITVMVKKKLYQVINPEIAWQSGTQVNIEVCFSVPNKLYQVSRSEEMVLQGFDPEGKEICVLVNSIVALVFQHEIDHLNGILINSKGKVIEQTQKVATG
jgi:peptide deformylase